MDLVVVCVVKVVLLALPVAGVREEAALGGGEGRFVAAQVPLRTSAQPMASYKVTAKPRNLRVKRRGCLISRRTARGEERSALPTMCEV